MTNQEILNKLMLRDTDREADTFDAQNRTYNAQSVKKYLSLWNVNESAFPIDDIKRYIRLNEWHLADFDTNTELLIQRILPPWFSLVFIKMKQFRSNNRNELSSQEEAFGKLMGYPMNTQDEKAFVLYDALHQYYVNK